MNDFAAQLLEGIHESLWFVIQVDDSTDVDNKAILLVFVRFIFQGDVHEDLLCALFLPLNTTAADLFKSLNDYISGRLKRSFWVGVYTDWVAAMTGWFSGLTRRIKGVAIEISQHTVSSIRKC